MSDKNSILTVSLPKLCALAGSGVLAALFLLSFTRIVAHLHVKNISAAPRENTIMDSMTIADPKPESNTINSLQMGYFKDEINCVTKL